MKLLLRTAVVWDAMSFAPHLPMTMIEYCPRRKKEDSGLVHFIQKPATSSTLWLGVEK